MSATPSIPTAIEHAAAQLDALAKGATIAEIAALGEARDQLIDQVARGEQMARETEAQMRAVEAESRLAEQDREDQMYDEIADVLINEAARMEAWCGA